MCVCVFMRVCACARARVCVRVRVCVCNVISFNKFSFYLGISCHYSVSQRSILFVIKRTTVLHMGVSLIKLTIRKTVLLLDKNRHGKPKITIRKMPLSFST